MNEVDDDDALSGPALPLKVRIAVRDNAERHPTTEASAARCESPHVEYESTVAKSLNDKEESNDENTLSDHSCADHFCHDRSDIDSAIVSTR
ncbi:hypothetical protein [Aporhodopirellula rubra]|uniref:hypothetical protein n=1 Tax=Aporhodopirellula rubra TaxID=980271 RepID=UPI00160C5A08|nr:hypothetical protein [Aporhodopirellula rubra]